MDLASDIDDFGEEVAETPAPPEDPVRLLATAELGLIAACMLDGGEALDLCVRERLRPTAFTEPVYRMLFEVFVELHANNQPTDEMSVMEILRGRKARTLRWIKKGGELSLLEWMGGVSAVIEINNQIETTAHAHHWLRLVKSAWLARIARYKAEEALQKIEANPQETRDVLHALRGELEAVELQWDGGYSDAKGFADFAYPTDHDDACLLGNDWLNRGATGFLVSFAGQGKSSMCFGMSVHWALGRNFMGIRCRKPLRILMIQAEDDDRYIGELKESAVQAMNLGRDEIRQLQENLMIVTDKTHLGAEFGPMVRHYAVKHRPDLVIVNPLYLYAEGDISKNEVATRFAVQCEKANEDQRFAYLIVHHTGKPAPKDPKKGRAEIEDWEAIYMGLGGSTLSNWPRVTMLLEPTKTTGQYVLRFGKRGYRAGISEVVKSSQGAHEIPKPTNRINVQHSKKSITVKGQERPMIFWEVVEKNRETAGESDQKARPNAGRPAVLYSEAREYLRIFPADKPLGFTQLHKLAKQIDGITAASFRRRILELLECGEIRQHPGAEGYSRNLGI